MTAAFQTKRYDFSGVALDRWHLNDPVATHFYNAFFIIIPAYERLVITVMSRTAKTLNRPELSRAARDFAQQESAHSKEHVRFNKALEDAGYQFVGTFDRAHQRIVDWMLDHLPLRFLQSIAAFGELMTASICGAYLNRRRGTLDCRENQVDEFWTWHSSEEVEHQSFCLDVFVAADTATGHSYAMRLLGMFVGLPLFQFTIFANQVCLLFRDGRFFQMKTVVSLLAMWGRHALQTAAEATSYAMPGFGVLPPERDGVLSIGHGLQQQ